MRPSEPCSICFSLRSDLLQPGAPTVEFNKLDYGCIMICARFASFAGLGLEGGHVSTFWLLLQCSGSVQVRLLQSQPKEVGLASVLGSSAGLDLGFRVWAVDCVEHVAEVYPKSPCMLTW